jgi:hypothetical protein
MAEGWFELTVSARGEPSDPLVGPVSFYPHPDVAEPTQVEAEAGVASMTMRCGGAFTIGAVTDGGTITLELDLSTPESGLPEVFRER